MAGNAKEQGRTVTSKAVALILVFRHGSRYTLTDMARLAGLPVATAHRLTGELAAAGILRRAEDGRFQVGPRLHAMVQPTRLRPGANSENARFIVEDLATAVPNATVRLGTLADLKIRYIEKTPGFSPVPTFDRCKTGPVHASAMGKVLLAFADRRLARQAISLGLPAYTRFTLTRPDQLRRAVALTRLNKVAWCERELDPKAWSVAVPILGPDGQAVAALELETHDPRQLSELHAPLAVAARWLSRNLSVQPGAGPFQLGPQPMLSA